MERTPHWTGLAALLAFVSPAFPIGAYAYSHGLEWAVEAGDIRDRASLEIWLADLLTFGGLRCDCVFVALAWRAAREERNQSAARETLKELSDWSLALACGAERRLENSAQGAAFMIAARAAWPCAALELLAADQEDIAYPIAFGVACAGHDVPLAATCEGFLCAGLANLTSAAVRLGPIGQTDAQRLLVGFQPRVGSLAAACLQAGPDDIWGCAWRSDIAAMRHERQYSRLFRT